MDYGTMTNKYAPHAESLASGKCELKLTAANAAQFVSLNSGLVGRTGDWRSGGQRCGFRGL
jgi:hypothetical protein